MMPHKNPEDRKAYREANKEKRNAQSKAWNEANKEKIKAQSKAWKEANPEKIKAVNHKHWEKNKEKLSAANKNWRVNNKEKKRAYNKAWNEVNKEKKKAYDIVWRQAHRGRYNALKKAYKERKNQNNFITTKEDKQLAKWIYTMSSKLSEITGTKWHVDHIKPLSKGGMHSLDNLQIVPAVWNLQKNNTTEERWNG